MFSKTRLMPRVLKNKAQRKPKAAVYKPRAVCKHVGQAKKSKGRMPRHQKPKKDAESCEKPRGSAYN